MSIYSVYSVELDKSFIVAVDQPTLAIAAAKANDLVQEYIRTHYGDEVGAVLETHASRLTDTWGEVVEDRDVF